LAGIALVPIEAPVALAVLMIALGIGLGMTLPVVMVASQMAVGPALIGLVTATTSFFRSLGGAIGIALLTSLLFAWLGTSTTPTDAGGSGAAGMSMLAGGDPGRLREAFALVFGAASLASLAAAAAALWLPAVAKDRNGPA
jgi:hypothetical protein